MKIVKLLMLFFLFIPTALIFADTLYLKNGRSIEGLIIKDTANQIDLNVGFGTVTFEKNAIERIDKSDYARTRVIKNKWEENRLKSDSIKALAEEERQKAIVEWKKRQKEDERLREESGPKEVEFSKASGHMAVDALLNDIVHVSLMVDTGASVIILTNKVAKKLGIDTDKEKANIQLQVADGRKINAKYVILKSVSIRDAEARNVEAAILADNTASFGFKDGLLGMSFLKRFNFKFDYSNDRLILEER
jgi:clan AA aspartic protease (TIGR02281 family)